MQGVLLCRKKLAFFRGNGTCCRNGSRPKSKSATSGGNSSDGQPSQVTNQSHAAAHNTNNRQP
eukprot:4748037-Amphidinium_carterae.1